MARKSGRGLFLGKEDFIPLERVDLLDDLKRFVDVHRLTDFSLSDKIVPTIELRRTEDEIVGAVGATQGGGIGQTTMQLFAEPAAAPLGVICRPIVIAIDLTVADTIIVGYLPFSGGAVITLSADPRRPAADLVGTGVHVDGTTAIMGNPVFRMRLTANTTGFIPIELLQRMASVAGQCLTVQAVTIGTALDFGVVWRVERPQLTRKQG